MSSILRLVLHLLILFVLCQCNEGAPSSNGPNFIVYIKPLEAGTIPAKTRSIKSPKPEDTLNIDDGDLSRLKMMGMSSPDSNFPGILIPVYTKFESMDQSATPLNSKHDVDVSSLEKTIEVVQQRSPIPQDETTPRPVFIKFTSDQISSPDLKSRSDFEGNAEENVIQKPRSRQRIAMNRELTESGKTFKTAADDTTLIDDSNLHKTNGPSETAEAPMSVEPVLESTLDPSQSNSGATGPVPPINSNLDVFKQSGNIFKGIVEKVQALTEFDPLNKKDSEHQHPRNYEKHSQNQHPSNDQSTENNTDTFKDFITEGTENFQKSSESSETDISKAPVHKITPNLSQSNPDANISSTNSSWQSHKPEPVANAHSDFPEQSGKSPSTNGTEGLNVELSETEMSKAPAIESAAELNQWNLDSSISATNSSEHSYKPEPAANAIADFPKQSENVSKDIAQIGNTDASKDPVVVKVVETIIVHEIPLDLSQSNPESGSSVQNSPGHSGDQPSTNIPSDFEQSGEVPLSPVEKANVGSLKESVVGKSVLPEETEVHQITLDSSQANPSAVGPSSTSSKDFSKQSKDVLMGIVSPTPIEDQISTENSKDNVTTVVAEVPEGSILEVIPEFSQSNQAEEKLLGPSEKGEPSLKPIFGRRLMQVDDIELESNIDNNCLCAVFMGTSFGAYKVPFSVERLDRQLSINCEQTCSDVATNMLNTYPEMECELEESHNIVKSKRYICYMRTPSQSQIRLRFRALFNIALMIVILLIISDILEYMCRYLIACRKSKVNVVSEIRRLSVMKVIVGLLNLGSVICFMIIFLNY